MPTYSDLFELHLRYADYVREKTYLIHQYLPNIGLSGSGVEVEVRALLRSMLPSRYRITTGYIVNAATQADEPTVSPQVDILIVDTLVPHSLWLIDQTQGVEIVPREAVVGIIEVKRTLTPAALTSAAEQVRAITEAADLTGDDAIGYLPGGLPVGMGLNSPYRGNPLVGIIGLDAEGDVAETPTQQVIAAVTAHPSPLDFVLAISGMFVATANPVTTTYEPRLVKGDAAEAWAEASERYGNGGRVALAHGLGFILAFVGNVCGRVAHSEKYFFNHAIQ